MNRIYFEIDLYFISKFKIQYDTLMFFSIRVNYRIISAVASIELLVMFYVNFR